MSTAHTATVTVYHDEALTHQVMIRTETLSYALEVAFDAFRAHALDCRQRFRGRKLSRFSVRVDVTSPTGWVSETFLLYGAPNGRVTEYRGIHHYPGSLPHWSEQATDWAMADAPNLPLAALNDAAAKITDLPDHDLTIG